MSHNPDYTVMQDGGRQRYKEETQSSTPASGDNRAAAEIDATICKEEKEMHETFDQVHELVTECNAEVEVPKQQPMFLVRLMRRVIPPGGFASGVFNLAGSSLGAGILGLPYAFDTSGIVMGTIYLIVIYLLTVYSVRLLAIVYGKTGIRSYELTARILFGRGGDIFTAVIMFIKCMGACIAYVICINDLWHAFLNDDRVQGYYRSVSFQRVLTSEGITSKGLRLFNTGNRAIQGLGQFVFAFLCQSNAYQVFNETPKPSVRFFELQVLVSMLICTVFYWVTGFFGYCDFGDKVGSSLLRMYRPLTDYYFAVAYVGLVVKLCVAFALHILPSRDSVHHLIGWDLHTVAWWKNAVLCTFLSLVSLLCGLFIPNVNTVFGLLGSFTGGFIAFVFPALFFIYSGGYELKKVGYYNYFGAIVLLICGVTIICFGTTATIYGVV
ncbi:Transmembrane amino acid transporter family protein [Leishmania donovani]|uniref:Transmembrane amino acid transporter family protein n=1 Tax=Leishmania donovani TaxID=5661 RepID=A0A504XC70_LEIDO|nr:Transmembrane amino acid transporter family protein [Leishmania donovani]